MDVSLTGYATLILLALALILPMRMTALERFLPLPDAQRLHHGLGIAVVVVGTLHAGLAMKPYLRFAPSPWQSAKIFFDPADSLITTGSLALGLLIITVAASFCSSLPRRWWLWIHRLSILGFGLTLTHIALIWGEGGSPSPGEMATRFAIAALVVTIALGLTLYLLRPEWLASHRTFTVQSIDHLRPGVVALTLELGAGSKPWRPGQYGYFRFDCRGPCGVSLRRHPFTVADMADPTVMRVVVKALGPDTHCLQQVMIGTTGEVAGPYGPLPRRASRETSR